MKKSPDSGGLQIQDIQQEFEKASVDWLRRSVHQISVDAFSLPATRFLQLMNLDSDSIPADYFDPLSMQQMIWEEINKVKTRFFSILSDLGATAPTGSSPIAEKQDFATYCEYSGFIGDLAAVMVHYQTYPVPSDSIRKEQAPDKRVIAQYVLLRHTQLEASKAQFLQDIANRWGLKPETLLLAPYKTYAELVDREKRQTSIPAGDTNKSRIQRLLEFPDSWMRLLGRTPASELIELEQTLVTGTIFDTSRSLLTIANNSTERLPDFPIFQTYLQLFDEKAIKRTGEQVFFEDFLYAVWKEAFTNTVVTLRESGVEKAREVWNVMYQDLDFNTDMLVHSASETNILTQLSELDKRAESLDDIRNQFMDQFLRDEIPGVVKAVRGFLQTLIKEDNEPIRVEMARAFRMTESSININSHRQLKEAAELVADVLEDPKADFKWIRAHKEDILGSLEVIDILREIALGDAVMTLETIEKTESFTTLWNGLIQKLGIVRGAAKPKAEPDVKNFKDDSGIDFFGDLTDSLGDDLAALDPGALPTE
ncbi:MAG: hypothetical protein HUU10_11365 [Bacteroidetes bacterium]|nr:hypothetical protein [Bacteroidota bacterium]